MAAPGMTDPMARPVTRTSAAEPHDTVEGLVLYNPATDTVHQLNPMSTLIYELADGRSVESIARSVALIFALDLQQARALVAQGVADLTDLNLVG